MSGIFLSYSREDRQRVAPLVDFLLSKGLSVWWDRDIQPGDSFEESIDQQIMEAKCVIVVWSHTSVQSRWVKNEALEGQDRNILVPVLIDDVRIPVAFKQSQAADFRQWPDHVSDHQIQTLLSAVFEKLERKDQPDGSYIRPKKKRPFMLASIAAILAIAIGLAYFWVHDRNNMEYDSPKIAVMRFRDITDGEQTYLADSLSSEIYQNLRPVENIRISTQFASWDVPRDMSYKDAADRLDASYLVYGKLISNGPETRVMISLRDQQGRDLWEREYQVSSNSIQQVTQRVSDHLLTQLNVTLMADSNQAINHYITKSELAYDYYLKGKNLIRQSNETDVLKQARDNFEKAIAEDGRFVQAYSALCSTNIFLYESSHDRVQFESAERACNRALTLAPAETEAYLALGNLYRYSGQAQLAEPQLQRVLNLEPNNADAHIALGYLYSDLQKYDEALFEFNLAVESQPGYWRSFNARGVFHYEQGEYPQAIENFTEVTLLNPQNTAAYNNLGTAKYLNGQFNEAIETWKRLEAISPGWDVLSNIGTGYYYLRDYARAQAMYEKAIQASAEDHRLWGNLADAQRMSQLDSAAENYRTAIELAMGEHAINNSDAMNLSRLAVYHAALGNRGKAIEFLRLAQSTGGGNPYVLYDVVVAWILLDSLTDALDFYKLLEDTGFPMSILNAEPMFDALRGTTDKK
jgi:tetratricopeptide (TPR) repeat protein